MGNGHFGTYFIGSDSTGRQTVSSSRRTIPRDYERTLYKTGHFPYIPESKTITPCDTPTTSAKAIPINRGATPSYGKLTATRPVSTMAHVQRYDNCASQKQNGCNDATIVFSRNFGRSYNRVFRHHDDFQLNYKECYGPNQLVYNSHCSRYNPCQRTNYFRDSPDVECCKEDPPCTKYLTGNSRFLKGADDCTTNTDFDCASSNGKVDAVSSIASSVGGSFRFKGCQTDPSPWILYENNHNWKLMVVKPHRTGQIAAPPISVSPEQTVVDKPDTRTPFSNGITDYGSPKEVQTDPGIFVMNYNPTPNADDLVQSYPHGSFNSNRIDPVLNKNNPVNFNNDPVENSRQLKPNPKNVRTENKPDGVPKRKPSKVVTQQPSTQLKNSENDIVKRKKSVPRSKKSTSNSKPERNPSRINGGIGTTGTTNNPSKLNNTIPGKTTIRNPNTANPLKINNLVTGTPTQLPHNSSSPPLEKSPVDPQVPSLTPSLQLLQKPSSTKGSQTDPKNPNKTETSTSDPNKIIVSSKNLSTPQDNPKGENRQPIKPPSQALVPAPHVSIALDPFSPQDSRENLPRRKEPQTNAPTPSSSSHKLKRRTSRYYNPQDLLSVKPIYTSKTISTSGSDEGQPYFVPSRPSRFRKRKSKDFNSRPKSSSDTSVPRNNPPASVPPSITSSSSPERTNLNNVRKPVKKADSYNGPMQSSSPVRTPPVSNPSGVSPPNPKKTDSYNGLMQSSSPVRTPPASNNSGGVSPANPSDSRHKLPVTGSNSSVPPKSGLIRYPSRHNATDPPIFMARKHSINQLKESLSRQGSQGKPPSQHPSYHEKRVSLGKTPLTIPSAFSLEKLRQSEFKLVTRAEAKQEMEMDKQLKESGLIILPPGNQGRSRLVSVLKKPSITKTSKSSSSQSLRKKRSVRFNGVPPTPPSP